jgi:alpha-amylase
MEKPFPGTLHGIAFYFWKKATMFKALNDPAWLREGRRGIPIVFISLVAAGMAAGCVAAPTCPASDAGASITPSGAPDAPFDLTPVPVGDTSSELDPSWIRGPFMEVFVRAYKDSNGDGDGDLEGLIQSLDYLQALGIRGLWMMGIFPSWDHDHGYMVEDYRDVDPNYGTLETLDRLLAEAHKRGIGVVLDYATNMSAATHPGFLAASADPDSPWRDWYIFSDTHPPGWSAGLWQNDPWRPTKYGWYYAFFDVNLPEFNWKNPKVTAYHENTFRFWLNRGVDGFRLDSAGFLIENGRKGNANQPETWAALAGLRNVVDQYRNRFMVCEGPMPEYAIREICGGAFGFDRASYAGGERGEISAQRAILAALGDPESVAAVANYPLLHPIGKISMLLQNHDSWWGDRLWDQFGGDTPAYRLAAAQYLLMPGIPFIYYGEEIGMADIATQDFGNEVRRRGPMSWTGEPITAGFTTASVLLAPKDGLYKYFQVSPNAATHNVADETDDPDSLLNYYKALVALRNGHPALNGGGYRLLAAEGTGFAFERKHAGESIIVALNYGGRPMSAGLGGLEPGQYDPLFAYGADPTGLTVGGGGDASVAMPARSVQAFRLARGSTPFGVAMYLRGTMNDWEAADTGQFEYIGSDLYELKIYLPAGDYAFKIAGYYWEYGFAAVDWRDIRYIRPDEPFTLETTGWDVHGGEADILRMVVMNGEYVFSIDASNVLAPVLTVRPAA